MPLIREIRESFLHLLFPHTCAGCGSDNLSRNNLLCIRCMEKLPETHFERFRGNPVEKKFWGRLPLRAAMALYYFARESLVQQLIHQFKYKGNKELGRQLGLLMGDAIKQSERFIPDALVPLPLFASKEKRRGFNQSDLLCQGIAEHLGVPVLNNVITRPRYTETQTHKGRIDRWKNIEGKFLLTRPEAVAGKHLLLVDDVVTTGATLEACGSELIKTGNVELSVGCLCYSSR